MNWRTTPIMACLAVCLQLPAAPKVPAFADYEIVLKRNVFDANRQPYREPEPPPVPVDKPEPPPVAKTLTLAGVFMADARSLALFVAGDKTCTNVAVGEELTGLTILAVDSAGARLKAGEKSIQVAVGEQLSDGGKGEWSVVGRAEQAPSAKAVVDEQKAASRAELLKRMMERRKREIGQ